MITLEEEKTALLEELKNFSRGAPPDAPGWVEDLGFEREQEIHRRLKELNAAENGNEKGCDV